MSKTSITLLGISGSPRLKSTHYAVNEALEYARDRHDVETDYFSVARQGHRVLHPLRLLRPEEAGLHP